MKAFKPFRSPDAAVIKIKAEKRGLGSLRTLLTVFLIFLQLVILVSLYFTLAEVFPWYVGLSLGLSVACCIYTLSSDRSPSSKAVWVFILLIFFFVGHILFILTDEKVFFTVLKSGTQRCLQSRKSMREKVARRPPTSVAPRTAHTLKRSADFPHTARGTRVTFLRAGSFSTR